MENENIVVVRKEEYKSLLNDRLLLELLKRVIFNDENRLSYNKEEIYFEISAKEVKLILPSLYEFEFKELREAENGTVAE